MTTDYLLRILSALNQNTDPLTGDTYSHESRLVEPEVRSALLRLTAVVEADARNRIDVPDETIAAAAQSVASLGYTPSYQQLAKVLYGSRTIVDSELRGLPCFGKYRGVYTRRLLTEHLRQYHRRFPDQLAGEKKRRSGGKPWSEIDFFRKDPFDLLEEDKAYELRQAVHALGFTKATDRLPAYMQQARSQDPRAFEPWDRLEQALLIEAMCYTNRLDRLREVFGRSARSLEGEGQRLIWKNRQQTAGAA